MDRMLSVVLACFASLLSLASYASAQQPGANTRPQPRYGQPAATGSTAPQQPAATAQPQPTATVQPAQAVTPQPLAAAPAQARSPFTNTPAEDAYIDRILQKWETDSASVKTFYCEFDRDVYHLFSPVLTSADGKTRQQHPTHKDKGKLGYIDPDKGSFEITERKTWTPEPVAPPKEGDPPAAAQQVRGDWKTHDEVNGEHWVCDGKFTYNKNYATKPKSLEVRAIPVEMQGKRISDGPMPFLFGAEVEKLKKRYWFRFVKELTNAENTRLGLHAKPKWQADRANYTDVYLVLRNEANKPLMPIEVRIATISYENNRPVYQSKEDFRFKLDDARINTRLDRWFAGMFIAPRTPFGWKRIEINTQTAGNTPQVPQSQQAQQPQNPSLRPIRQQ